MPHILIVEDEATIADALIYALNADGHTTYWTTLAGDALAYVAETRPDFVILDVGLPDQNGFETCKALRRFSDVPVLFLTARDSEIDRIVGLEIGADDYVVKPFSPREVAARVRSILKRVGPPTINPTINPKTPDEFSVDEAGQRIHFDSQPLTLTPIEYHVLACLLKQPERVFSRAQLLDAAGVSNEAGYERNIDSHIKSLRAKLRAVDPQRNPIQTQRGFGYRYQPYAHTREH